MDAATLENALGKKCKNHAWLAGILFLTATPVFFNTAHLAGYEFLGGNPSFFCNIPELVEANWTNEQIREISSPGLKKQSCVKYAWNYTLLKNMDFNEALNYFSIEEKPNTVKCKSYIYNENVFHKTVKSEWDLVCDDSSISSTAQGAVAIGKLLGSITFGSLSDRFGRKKIFILSGFIYAVSSTAAAFANSAVMFIISRILTGFGSGGVFDTCYTVLLELSVKNYRTCVGILFHTSYSIGMIYLSMAAYFTNSWRQLQLAISAPMVLFIIHFWFFPESPRWLITNGYYDKAVKILGGKYKFDLEQTAPSHSSKPQSILYKIMLFWKKNFKVFYSFELIKRLLISSYLWFVGSLYYFVVALNGSNIDVNEYLYVGLNGMIEIPGHLSNILFLKYFGRKIVCISLWIVAGATLIVTIVIPKGLPIMCVSLFGRLVGASGFGLVMLYVSELFPTEHRNFGVGICSTIGQLGPLIAPFLVQMLGEKAWWMPTTACGVLALISALLLTLLPETKYTPMPDKINEIKSNPSKERN